MPLVNGVKKWIIVFGNECLDTANDVKYSEHNNHDADGNNETKTNKPCDVRTVGTESDDADNKYGNNGANGW